MSVRNIRWIVAIYMGAFLLLTTWPGVTIFNTVEPFVLGLPLNLFVIATLIITALVVLVALYLSETRPRR